MVEVTLFDIDERKYVAIEDVGVEISAVFDELSKSLDYWKIDGDMWKSSYADNYLPSGVKSEEHEFYSSKGNRTRVRMYWNSYRDYFSDKVAALEAAGIKVIVR